MLVMPSKITPEDKAFFDAEHEKLSAPPSCSFSEKP